MILYANYGNKHLSHKFILIQIKGKYEYVFSLKLIIAN